MKKSSSSRQGSAARQRHWVKVYKARISQGLEYCRQCKSRSSDLTLGHIHPASNRGSYSMNNITILCLPCNRKQGIKAWTHLPSLALEESRAPYDQRWSTRARWIALEVTWELPELLDLEDLTYGW